MTDFVLEQEKKGMQNTDRPLRFERILKYAKFLKQTLTLSMFVPCDDDGNVLEEPKTPHTFSSENSDDYIKKWEKELEQYQQAKERVIFDGYKVIKFEDYYIIYDSHGRETWVSWNKSKTIESLINEITEVTITPNAVKTYQL